MRRLICLLLASCLPVTALADTVAERIGAPESWQGEFRSNTGRTRIFLDMAVQVPEVEAVPVWAVEPRVFAVEEVAHAADVFLGEGNWRQRSESNEAIEDELCYRVDSSDRQTRYSCSLVTGDSPEAGRFVSAYYDLWKGMGDWHLANALSYGVSGVSWGRDVPANEEAARLADEAVGQIAPEMVRESAEPTLDFPWERMGDAKGRSDYGYRFYYTRVLEGIPITVVREKGAGDAMETLNPVLPRESLHVDVGEHGIFQFDWDHPIEIIEKVAEDCELLPFDTIMDIVGRVGVLKYQTFESSTSTSLYIDRATLGYMCLQERGKPASYRLVPVWDFFGTREFYGEHEDLHNDSYLTINAIDGTVIDRIYGY